jgi:hypothetical protein
VRIYGLLGISANEPRRFKGEELIEMINNQNNNNNRSKVDSVGIARSERSERHSAQYVHTP